MYYANININKMDNIKELNAKSHYINSKHKKHTGQRVGHTQKSRSYNDDKSRKWRHNAKTDAAHCEKKNTKKDIVFNEFNANCKLSGTKRNWRL